MSRAEIQGEQFTMAFGIDHATGPFVQVWVSPADEQDCAIVVIDTTVRIEPTLMAEYEKLPRSAQEYVNWLKEALAARPDHHIAEEHVIELARRIGEFENTNLVRRVYEIFD